MTIYFPDVSRYNSAVDIQPGTVVVVARATLSDSYADPSYQRFKLEASNVGAFFVAYHWLNHGNIQAQAQWAYDHIGQTPLMIDAEDVAGNTGYNGAITVDDIVAFVNEYRMLGGVVFLVYLPHWYWQGHMQSPDLTPLVNVGLHLVSSNYTTYSDTGPGWTAYGHMSPEEWQYTDALPYGGSAVDFNAFRGTVEQFEQLAIGSPVITPVPPTPIQMGNVDMAQWRTVQRGSTGDQVRIAQGLLIGHGYAVGSVNGFPDGSFGPTTEASTKAFQQSRGIKVDGIFGPVTAGQALH